MCRPVAVYDALEQDDIFLPHPGKTIRHALEQISVANAMTTDAVTLTEGMAVAEAFAIAEERELVTFPGLASGSSKCVGSITEMRLRRNMAWWRCIKDRL